MTKSKINNGSKIGPEETKKRAEALLTVLELVYTSENRSVEYGALVKLIEGMPRASEVLRELFKTNILSKSTKQLKEKSIVKYTGIEPVYIVAKKIIVSVVEQGRKWNDRQRTVGSRIPKGIGNTAVPVVGDVEIKSSTPLHYNSFLKEIALLKERYRMTVPNATIEVTVKVSSSISV